MVQSLSPEKPISNAWDKIYLSVIFILIAPFISHWLMLVPLLIQLYRMVHYDEHIFMADMALLVNFSAVFMIPDIGSALSILVVAAVPYFIIKIRFVKLGYPLIAVSMLVSFLLFRIEGAYTDYIFISCNLILMFLLVYRCSADDAVKISRNFIIGILIASVYGYIFRGNPAITSFIAEDSIASHDYANVYRFRAIYLDSNYYSGSLILAMALTVELYIVKRLSQSGAMIILFMLSFFGIATYSRTFFVMFLCLIVLLVYLLFKHRKYFPLTMLLIVISLVVIFVLNGKINTFDVILSRIFTSKSLSKLTSGRSELFKKYLDYIIHSPRTFLVGDGLGAPLYGNLGTHNLYLETFYYIGISGAVLFFSYIQSLRTALRRQNLIAYPIKLKLLALLPLLMLMAVYFSLQGLMQTMLYVQIFIAITAYLLPTLLQSRTE